MINEKPIYITQPALPPLEEFIESLRQIWDNKILTNGGPFHQQLETELATFLGVEYVSLFANGTLALMTALQTLRITGEVITTPYTFVATTNAIEWNGIKPVFVDVDPKSGNIDPQKIEAAITNETTAIMPVHVYGNPCRTSEIKNIADTYGLKIIYDAAQAFSVKSDGKSILNEGNLSILSFHATKIFNTFEGGAIISHDEKTKERIDYLKNFGFAGENTIIAPGINGKMNELQAACGLLQLKYVHDNIQARKMIAERYNNAFENLSCISALEIEPMVQYNYSYYPIFIEPDDGGELRDKLYYTLKKRGIYARRYFFPLVTKFPMYQNNNSARDRNLQHAKNISEKVICLPIYPGLSNADQDFIIEILQGSLK
jgi:dTDP-4-amino-4,6-dideoxygalactose transaminase